MSVYDHNNEQPFDNTKFQTYLQRIEGLRYNRVAFVKKLIDQYGNTPITNEEVMDLKIDLGAYCQRIERERKERKKMKHKKRNK